MLNEKSLKQIYNKGYEHFALYRHPDYSEEWLPCSIEYTYNQEFDELDKELKVSLMKPEFEGFGIKFKDFAAGFYINIVCKHNSI